MGVARTTGRHSESWAERVDALVIRDVFCAENFLELGPHGLDAAVLPKRTFPYTRGRCGKMEGVLDVVILVRGDFDTQVICEFSYSPQ